MSKSIVVLGTQWGDEGKGKIVDLLTDSASVVARFQGRNHGMNRSKSEPGWRTSVPGAALSVALRC